MPAPHRAFARVLGTLAVVMAGARALGAPLAAADDSEDAFVAWIEETAIPIERWHANAELRAYLDRAVEGKRIVFIGEPGHFFAEKYDVQLMLIEHLAQRGFRHVFLEGLGASMAEVVDDFVRTGARPADAGADDSRRDRYRARAFAGLVGADVPEFRRRSSAAQQRFYAALRDLSVALQEPGEGLSIHPFDIDMMPGGCIFPIEDLLQRYADEDALDVVRDLVRAPETESVPEEIERLERLRSAIEEGGAADLGALTVPDRRRLRQHVDCLLESIVFFDTGRADGNLTRALVRREPAMFRQVQHALARLPDDARVVMIAHCNHVARDGADTMRARSPSVGEMIEAAHPGEVFSLWMLHDHGWLLNPMSPEPLEELSSDPLRIESLMVRAGSTFLLPLHGGAAGERYLDTKRRFSYFTWYEEATLTRQTDALFFLDEISPPTE